MTLSEIVKYHQIEIPLILQFMEASKHHLNSKFELSQFQILQELLVEVESKNDPILEGSRYNGKDKVSDMILETERFLRIIQFELFVYCKN